MSREPGPSEPKSECQAALHQIYTYLDGELTDEVRSAITIHLEDCPPCDEVFVFEAELKALVAQKCQEQAPAGLRARIAAALGLPPE